jgi:hypothetical protein
MEEIDQRFIAPQSNRFKPILQQKYLRIKVIHYLYFIGSILALTLLNIIFRDYLYALSIEFIMYLQNTGRDPSTLYYFTSYKFFASNSFLYTTVALLFIF